MKKQLTVLLMAFLACAVSGCSAPANDSIPNESEVKSTSFSQEISEESSQSSVSESSSTADTESSIVSTSSTESETPQTSETDLFDKVYSPYALRVYSPNNKDVTEFLKGCGFEYSVSTENGFTEIKVTSGEDYVYFCFAPRTVNGELNFDTFTTISYFNAASNSEVSLNNYSSDGDFEYDTLQTHIIGESSKDARSVTAQRDFVFSNVSQSSTNSNTESKAPTPVNFTLNTGKLLDVTVTDDNVLVIKAKISSLLSNKQTINQNYHNVEDIIRNQGGNKYSEIQYWAVADMADGSEGKVISFTVPKDLIESTAKGYTVAIQYPDLVTDLWILPSLRE